MKKYITVIPMQPIESLHKTSYEAKEGDELLTSDLETRFPVMVMIKNSAVENEEIEIVAIVTKGNDNVRVNYDLFVEELDEISKAGNFRYKINNIETTLSETPEKQFELLKNIVEILNDGDIIYSDITYGAKPTPIVIMMAMNYAYEFLKNTDIRAMIYGSFNHSTNKTAIFDVSSLFYMNSLMFRVSRRDMENPLETMKAIIDL